MKYLNTFHTTTKRGLKWTKSTQKSTSQTWREDKKFDPHYQTPSAVYR